VEGGGEGLTVSGVSRNRGSFVKCVAIQKRLGIPAIDYRKGVLLEIHLLAPLRIACVRSPALAFRNFLRFRQFV
jgi:hypothetical protein